MDFLNVWIFLEKEIRNARKNRWFIVTAFIFSTLCLGLSLLGFSGLGTLGVAGFGRTSASLVNLVLLIVPLMAMLLGAMALTVEKEQGTLRTLLAQPVTRSEIFLGKFLGSAMALLAAILFGFGLSGLVISFYAGTEQIGSYLGLVVATILLGLVFLGIGFLVSILAPRSSAAVGLVILLWFLFLFASDLGFIGAIIALKLSSSQIFYLTLLNPSQIFKMLAVYQLHGDFDIFGPAGRYAWDTFGDLFFPLLGIFFAFWILVPLALGLFLFRKGCGG